MNYKSNYSIGAKLPSLDYREREFEGSERSSEGQGGIARTLSPFKQERSFQNDKMIGK